MKSQGIAQIAVHESAREAQVLSRQRLIEAEFDPGRRDLLGARVLADVQIGGIAAEVQRREGDDRDPDHDDDTLQQPLCEQTGQPHALNPIR